MGKGKRGEEDSKQMFGKNGQEKKRGHIRKKDLQEREDRENK